VLRLQTKAETTKKNDQYSQPQVPAVSARVSAVPTDSNENHSSSDIDIQRKIEVFTGLLVVVGFLQVGVMVLQWLMYRRQAKIMAHQAHEMTQQRVTMHGQLDEMEAQTTILNDSVAAANKSANAALLNAQALIDSERAWIMVDVETRPPGVTQSTNAQPNQRFTMIDVKVICSNEGNTVAWITEKRSFFGIITNGLPHEFTHLRCTVFQREPEALAPGGTTEINVHSLAAGYRGDGGNLIVFYGFVKYRDIFNQDRETRFGYLVNIDNRLERIPDYPEYDKNI